MNKFTSSLASKLAGVSRTSVRNYIAEGVVFPEILNDGTRLFSDGDIERLRARGAEGRARRGKRKGTP